MSDKNLRMPLCQVAISSVDLQRSVDWYQSVFGFAPAGNRIRLHGPVLAKVSGLPEISASVAWVVDQQNMFQMEIFEFDKPEVRLRAHDSLPSDIGYAMLRIHVDNFDQFLDRVSNGRDQHPPQPWGGPGTRRVCIKDPDGILIEVMEDDIRKIDRRFQSHPKIFSSVRGITLSVPDLDKARAFWVAVLGLVIVEDLPIHEICRSGVRTGERRVLTLDAGDFLVEIVQYVRPSGKPRPAGYLISDQGILNVALGTTEIPVFDSVHRRILKSRYTLMSPPWTLPNVSTVVYAMDDQGFSVELLHVYAHALEKMGFVPNTAQTNGGKADGRRP